MNQVPKIVKQSLVVFSVFSATVFATFWAVGNSWLFKSTPYTTRNTTSDTVLSQLTNWAGAGILDGLITKVKAKAIEKGWVPLSASLYTAYIDAYLSKVDQLDNTTRAQFGSDYAFIFQYIYPRIYEIRIPTWQITGIFSELNELVNTGSTTTTGSTVLQPELTINRTIGGSGQTISWTSKNIQTIAYISTGPNGVKTGTNLELNPTPVSMSIGELYSNGWIAGEYSVVWTVTGNWVTKNYNETFSIPSVNFQTENTCTNWTYTPTEVCQANGTQKVTASNPTPSGCTGWSPKTTQTCTYTPAITCTGNLPSDMTGVGTPSEYSGMVFGAGQEPNTVWKYGAGGSCTWPCQTGYFPNLEQTKCTRTFICLTDPNAGPDKFSGTWTPGGNELKPCNLTLKTSTNYSTVVLPGQIWVAPSYYAWFPFFTGGGNWVPRYSAEDDAKVTESENIYHEQHLTAARAFMTKYNMPYLVTPIENWETLRLFNDFMTDYKAHYTGEWLEHPKYVK